MLTVRSFYLISRVINNYLTKTNKMKKITTLFILLFSAATFAQSVSVDMTNKYVWRGADLGGFSIQPNISTEVGPVEVGVWSSYALNDNSLSELDLYVSGSIGSFDLAVTNYYFPGATTDGALDFAGGSLTGLEGSIGTTLGSFSIMGAYFFDGEDTYVEVGYPLAGFDVAIGAGDTGYSMDGEFALVNVSLSTGKDIKITEDFSLPLSGSLIYNPDTDIMYVAVGVSL